MDLLRLASQQSSGVLLASEAEVAIRNLQLFAVEEIGSSRWLKQQEVIEALNAQAHRNAQQHSDEFVVEGLISYDKLSLLVQDLLTFEVWKAKVYPHLKEHFALQLDSISAYLVLYHEVALTNLLEVTLYHRHACEAVAEGALVELCDWCQRRATALLSTDPPTPHLTDVESAKHWLSKSPQQDLADREAEIAFGTCMASLTILRYLTDHIMALPLGIIPRLMRSNDILAALMPLATRKPWLRHQGRQLEKYEGAQWTTVDIADRLRVTQYEAQVWLALHNLLTEPACRSHCTLDERCMDQLARLRPLLSDVLLDQVPVLKNLAHLLDQVILSGGQASGEARSSCLIIEQVPTLREALLKHKDWQDIACQQCTTHFAADCTAPSHARLESFMQALSLHDDSVSSLGPQQAAAPAQVRVHVWRRLKLDLLEPWAEFTCALDDRHPPEPVQVAADDGTQVFGSRHRIKPLDMDNPKKSWPCHAKVAVVYGGASAEAWMDLPTAETRSGIQSLPAVVWVTVGLLGIDGFALQLKCRKTEAMHRDRRTGAWCVFTPVGGAFNLRNSLASPRHQREAHAHPALIPVHA